MSSDIIFVLEGLDGIEKIIGNKRILSNVSPYFRILLGGSFRESLQSEIVIKDVDADTFRNFINLIERCPYIANCDLLGLNIHYTKRLKYLHLNSKIILIL